MTRSNVEEIQRSRILGAMAEEVAARGVAAVTVARVIARARVSRRLFYELFADVEDCFIATFDWTVDQARVVVLDAYGAEKDWRSGIRGALAALLRFFDEQPLLAQLCVVHAAGGGTRVLERRSRVIGQLCEAIDRGGSDAPGARAPGPVVAEGVVGAVLAVLYTRLLERGSSVVEDYPGGEEQTAPLIELHGELMSLILLPYMGATAAGRELHRLPPPPRAQAPAATGLLESVATGSTRGARLTYRTVCVLRAIAELPAASNREVAERAGIVDQGQISKILTRLEYQGLVVNRGGSGPARGTPNSWWLTTRGEELERELRERPPSEPDAAQSPLAERKATPRTGKGSRQQGTRPRKPTA